MNLTALIAAGALFLCREFEVPALDAAADPPEWIHVAPYGEWRGHPMGAFQVGPEQVAQIVANFPPRDIVIDWEHQSHLCESNGKDAPAAGWIDRVEVRSDGLWAHVRTWTPRAIQQFRDREYRYLSPVLAWHYPNKVTGLDQGATLLSVALTNTPFFDVLTPLLARANHPGRIMDKVLLALLGLPETATPEEARAAAQGIIDRGLTACRALGFEAKAKPTSAEIEAKGKVLLARAQLGDAVVRELKVDAATPVAEVEVRLCSELKHSGYVPFEQHAAALQGGADRHQAVTDEQLIDRGIREGKITPALETWARASVKTDRAGLERWMASAKGVPVTSPITTPITTPKAKKLDAEDVAYCRQMGITEAEFLKAQTPDEVSR